MFLDDEEWGAVLRRAAAVLARAGTWSSRPATRTDATGRRGRRSCRLRQIEDDVEGRVEAWHEVTEVSLPFVSFASHFRFADGSMAGSPSTLRFRTRAEIEQSLADAWLDLVEVREAPDRPGREMVVHRAQAGGPA